MIQKRFRRRMADTFSGLEIFQQVVSRQSAESRPRRAASKARPLRFESLEHRLLLAANPVELQSIDTAHVARASWVRDVPVEEGCKDIFCFGGECQPVLCAYKRITDEDESRDSETLYPFDGVVSSPLSTANAATAAVAISTSMSTWAESPPDLEATSHHLANGQFESSGEVSLSLETGWAYAGNWERWSTTFRLKETSHFSMSLESSVSDPEIMLPWYIDVPELGTIYGNVNTDQEFDVILAPGEYTFEVSAPAIFPNDDGLASNVQYTFSCNWKIARAGLKSLEVDGGIAMANVPTKIWQSLRPTTYHPIADAIHSHGPSGFTITPDIYGQRWLSESELAYEWFIVPVHPNGPGTTIIAKGEGSIPVSESGDDWKEIQIDIPMSIGKYELQMSFVCVDAEGLPLWAQDMSHTLYVGYDDPLMVPYAELLDLATQWGSAGHELSNDPVGVLLTLLDGFYHRRPLHTPPEYNRAAFGQWEYVPWDKAGKAFDLLRGAATRGSCGTFVEAYMMLAHQLGIHVKRLHYQESGNYSDTRPGGVVPDLADSFLTKVGLVAVDGTKGNAALYDPSKSFPYDRALASRWLFGDHAMVTYNHWYFDPTFGKAEQGEWRDMWVECYFESTSLKPFISSDGRFAYGPVGKYSDWPWGHYVYRVMPLYTPLNAPLSPLNQSGESSGFEAFEAVFDPIDSDGDSFYESLTFDLQLDGPAGDYFVMGQLFAGEDLITVRSAPFEVLQLIPLSVGGGSPATVRLVFSGEDIYLGAQDGTYTVRVPIIDAGGTVIDTLEFYTELYHNEFGGSSPKVGSVVDYAIDGAADGVFEALSARVEFDIRRAVPFWVSVTLWDDKLNRIGSYAERVEYSDNAVVATFDGRRIASADSDGPYTVYVDIFDELGTPQAQAIHKTAAYSRIDFTPPGVVIQEDATDSVVDSDGDGLFDLLVIDTIADVAEPGEYRLRAWLRDSYGMLIERVDMYRMFSVGTSPIEFQFNGTAIGRNGSDGPFELARIELVRTDGGDSYLISASSVHRTASYAADHFQGYTELPRLSLVTVPTAVFRPDEITLEAESISAPQSEVVRVEFYRDGNDNGLWEEGIDEHLGADEDGSNGWSLSSSTATWAVGSHTLFARAMDNDGLWSNVVWTTAIVRPSTVRDLSPPAALLNVADVTATGAFTVKFTDATAVNVATLRDGNLCVRGPGFFQQQATLVSVSHSTHGAERTATYQITAPGGSWDAADSGYYEIWMLPLQVADLDHNYVGFGRLGTFAVTIEPALVGEVPTEPAGGVADDRFEIVQGQFRLRPGKTLSTVGSPTVDVVIAVPDTSSPENGNPMEIALGVQTTAWRNPLDEYDVTGEGVVSPLDALWVITELNTAGGQSLPLLPVGVTITAPFYDVSGDYQLSPLDALLVITRLNRPPESEGEAEGEGDPVTAAEMALVDSQLATIRDDSRLWLQPRAAEETRSRFAAHLHDSFSPRRDQSADRSLVELEPANPQVKTGLRGWDRVWGSKKATGDGSDVEVLLCEIADDIASAWSHWS